MNLAAVPPPLQRPKANPLLWIALSLLWLGTLIALPLRCRVESPAWDARIYLQGVDSVRANRDPYADAIARQEIYHQQQAQGIQGPTPFSYVYGPITLPVLWIVAHSPPWLRASVYWTLYTAGALTQLLLGFRFATRREHTVFLFLLPASIFFPGLLASDIVWSGNVAFILYGAILATALLGWTRRRWRWFYLVTVIACCFKAPLLTVLAIPVLTARKQWFNAGLTAVISILLYAGQALIAPTLSRHYLQAVGLQFTYNRDFGSSPAGLFGGLLYDHKLPYSPAVYFAYAAYVIPLAVVLVPMSRRFLRGELTAKQWFPLVLVGVLLLNPRILEYDENMIAIPLALILWRFFRMLFSRRVAIAMSFGTFIAFNSVAYINWSVWKLTEGPLLILFFVAGSWTLLRQSRNSPLRASSVGLSAPNKQHIPA